jgi:small subunit ribosomal protein S20
MANTRSAEKQARVGARRRAINKQLMSKARSLEKRVRALAVKGDSKGAAELMQKLQSAYDKAAKKKTIHRNKSARVKSKLAKLLKAGSAK